MKKIIGLLFVVVIGFMAYSVWDSNQKKKAEEDYKKIEAVQAAMEKVVYNKVIREADNQDGVTCFDLRIIYQSDNGFYNALKTELGSDFDTKLSTGDYIFVSVYPMKQQYKIYAMGQYDKPDDAHSQLYPEWTYDKLEKK